ncbi:hypothetical protein D9M71_585280 [compost metagenome]
MSASEGAWSASAMFSSMAALAIRFLTVEPLGSIRVSNTFMEQSSTGYEVTLSLKSTLRSIPFSRSVDFQHAGTWQVRHPMGAQQPSGECSIEVLAVPGEKLERESNPSARCVGHYLQQGD